MSESPGGVHGELPRRLLNAASLKRKLHALILRHMERDHLDAGHKRPEEPDVVVDHFWRTAEAIISMQIENILDTRSQEERGYCRAAMMREYMLARLLSERYGLAAEFADEARLDKAVDVAHRYLISLSGDAPDDGIGYRTRHDRTVPAAELVEYFISDILKEAYELTFARLDRRPDPPHRFKDAGRPHESPPGGRRRLRRAGLPGFRQQLHTLIMRRMEQDHLDESHRLPGEPPIVVDHFSRTAETLINLQLDGYMEERDAEGKAHFRDLMLRSYAEAQALSQRYGLADEFADPARLDNAVQLAHRYLLALDSHESTEGLAYVTQAGQRVKGAQMVEYFILDILKDAYEMTFARLGLVPAERGAR